MPPNWKFSVFFREICFTDAGKCPFSKGKIAFIQIAQTHALHDRIGEDGGAGGFQIVWLNAASGFST